MSNTELIYKSKIPMVIRVPQIKLTINLPKKDYVKGGFLPDKEQTISVPEQSAIDLLRCWPKYFEKKTKRTTKKQEVNENE